MERSRSPLTEDLGQHLPKPSLWAPHSSTSLLLTKCPLCAVKKKHTQSRPQSHINNVQQTYSLLQHTNVFSAKVEYRTLQLVLAQGTMPWWAVSFTPQPFYSPHNFNCCLSVHIDNYTIIVPTKYTSLLKAQDITICTFSLCILSPYMFRPTWAIFRGRNASA
jgi:hypothetical protein